MKLLIESVMIFLGTLMAAALVALGAPAEPRAGLLHDAEARSITTHQAATRLVGPAASVWPAATDGVRAR